MGFFHVLALFLPHKSCNLIISGFERKFTFAHDKYSVSLKLFELLLVVFLLRY